MPKRPPTKPPSSLAQIAAAIDRLRRDLQRLEESLAMSIETRELVVSGADGLPRVVIRAGSGSGEIAIYARDGIDVQSDVMLFGVDGIDGEEPHVGLALSGGGNIVGTFDVVGSDAPTIWIDEPP